MEIVTIVLTLIIIGVLLYLIEKYIPMNEDIKRIIIGLVIICVVIWLLGIFFPGLIAWIGL